MKEKYNDILEDIEELGVINVNQDEKIDISFSHHPNVVGPRSKYTGLPIWVGLTVATAVLRDDAGVQDKCQTKAFCWINEPFDYSRARIVTAGRALKIFGYPTKLADQVKD